MPLSVSCLSTVDIMAWTISCAYEYGGLASSLGDLLTARGRPLLWPAAFNTGVDLIVVDDVALTTGTGTGTGMTSVSLWYDGGTQTSSVSSDIGTTSVDKQLSSTTSDVDSSTYALTQLQRAHNPLFKMRRSKSANLSNTTLYSAA